MAAVTTSRAVTRGVRVEVEARYAPEHSKPKNGRWFFLYTVTITNDGDETVQLLNRHWVIQDANGKVEHVRGPGVVGEQPVLRRGQSFEYTSGCPLPTPFGSMHGSYEMRLETGETFDAEVAGFSLSQTGLVN